ncbi:MAG: NUDIX domain-containing protein [Nitrospira sp.]|nr:NUDIX domain-containing protein [Nitrospira sp.]
MPVVAGVVVYNHSLLLARNRQWPARRFSLITGYLERHEVPEQAIRRELTEELGLVAGSVQFVGHYLFERKNQLRIAYVVDAQGVPKLSDEIAEMRMIPISDVASTISVRLNSRGRSCKTGLNHPPHSINDELCTGPGTAIRNLILRGGPECRNQRRPTGILYAQRTGNGGHLSMVWKAWPRN